MNSIESIAPFQLFLAGAVSMLLLSLWAGRKHKRRYERRNFDRVAIVSWELVAFLSAFAGLYVLVMALRLWSAQ